VFITGPTGIGKTWMRVPWAIKACRRGGGPLSPLPRFSRSCDAKGDGRYVKLMTVLAKTYVLLLDTLAWLLSVMHIATTCWRCSKIAMTERHYRDQSTAS